MRTFLATYNFHFNIMAKSSSQTFEAARKGADEILKTARSGNYAPVYLLHGTEGYFIDKIESYITEKSLSEAEKAFNLTVVYGKDTNGGDVVAMARRYPMMAERQVIVVREAQSMRGIDELVHYLSAPLNTTVLVIAHRDKALDKRSALYKKFAAVNGAVLFESVSPRDWEVSKFVSANLTEKGLKAEPAAVEMIAENIGANLARISNEIDKLKTRLSADSSYIITQKDVEDNIGISKLFNNFELCKSLSMRKFDVALKIADHLSANVKETPIILTINALFTHFQRITILGFLRYNSARKGTPMPPQAEQSKLLKLPNPYFLEEYAMAANNYKLASCVAILGLIRQWDLKTKGMGAGSAENSELLRDLILRISLS